MRLIVRASFVGLLFASAAAHAQVQEEIRRCASISVDAERLACYDRLFRDGSPVQSRGVPSATNPSSAPAAAGAAGASSNAAAAGAAGNVAAAGAAPAAGASAGASSAAPGAVAGAAPAAGAAVAAGADFGANARMQEEQRRKAREEQGQPEAQELRARIKKVDPHPYGLHVLTLENGQVWQQKEKIWELELKPGDEIVIRRGMLGSYRLQRDGQGASTSVTRVK